METRVPTDPAMVVEVEQDRAREQAYRAGYDDAMTGSFWSLYRYVDTSLEQDYSNGYAAAQRDIQTGEVTVDEVVAAAAAVHLELNDAQPSGFLPAPWLAHTRDETAKAKHRAKRRSRRSAA